MKLIAILALALCLGAGCESSKVATDNSQANSTSGASTGMSNNGRSDAVIDMSTTSTEVMQLGKPVAESPVKTEVKGYELENSEKAEVKLK